jgi:hypothetical protein
MRGYAPTDTVPAKTAKRRDRAYRIAHYASTSTFIPPPADIVEEFTDDEEEEEEEAGGHEAEAELEIPEEAAAGNREQAPEASVVPEQALEAPVQVEQAPEGPFNVAQAPESSSPLYL